MPTVFTWDFVKAVAGDENLITIEEAKSRQILSPNGIPMFFANHDKVSYINEGFELVSDKYKYHDLVGSLAKNNRKISVNGIIIGKLREFKKIGYIPNEKD